MSSWNYSVEILIDEYGSRRGFVVRGAVACSLYLIVGGVGDIVKKKPTRGGMDDIIEGNSILLNALWQMQQCGTKSVAKDIFSDGCIMICMWLPYFARS